MTVAEALDIVVGWTGHVRYRELCDPAHPHHEAWGRVILGLAGVPPADAVAQADLVVPMSASLNLLRRMKACPHWRSSSSCGCGMNTCQFPWRVRAVSHRDCFECLGSKANC